MASPLFNTFGNQGAQGNLNNFLNQFNEFRKGFNGDPQQMVQQMLNSGRIRQEQFNQAANMAHSIMRFMK